MTEPLDIGPMGAAFGDVSDRAIRRQVRVPASPREVFAAFASTAGVTSWLVDAAHVELRIGGPYELLFDMEEPEGQQGSEGCRVLAWIPDRMLAFTWNAPPLFGELRDRLTWVVIELACADGGCTDVSITHLGWPESGFLDGSRWPQVFAYFERAWGIVTSALERRFANGKAPDAAGAA